jgi:hypothetical protein
MNREDTKLYLSSLIPHPSNPLPDFSPISPRPFHTKAVIFQFRET